MFWLLEKRVGCRLHWSGTQDPITTRCQPITGDVAVDAMLNYGIERAACMLSMRTALVFPASGSVLGSWWERPARAWSGKRSKSDIAISTPHNHTRTNPKWARAEDVFLTTKVNSIHFAAGDLERSTKESFVRLPCRPVAIAPPQSARSARGKVGRARPCPTTRIDPTHRGFRLLVSAWSRRRSRPVLSHWFALRLNITPSSINRKSNRFATKQALRLWPTAPLHVQDR